MGITVEVIEKGFSKRSSESLKLSILIGMDSFSYMIQDGQGKIQVLKEHLLDVVTDDRAWSELRRSEPLFDLNYEEIVTGLALPGFTFVPDPLFDKARQEEYLAYLTDLKEEDEVATTALASKRIHNIFILPDWLQNRMKTLPGGGAPVHLSGALLRYAMQHSAGVEVPFLWGHFLPERLWLVALENGALKYCNSFSFESENDALYYLLMLFDHMGLSPDRIPLHLSGKVAADLSLYKNIRRFVGETLFPDQPKGITLGTQLQKYPAHWFFDLFTLTT